VCKKCRSAEIAGFSLVLVVLAFFAAMPASRVSAEVTIRLSPTEGPVGTLVSVTGQINTINGSYSILFDNSPVKNGSSTLNNVSDTFTVENTTSGNHEVRLLDILNGTESSPLNFIVQREYVIKAITPEEPKQLQEGANVNILALITGGNASETLFHVSITVEDPANGTYSSADDLIIADANGYGNLSKVYPTDFNGGNQTTSFVGLYQMTLSSGNDTIATGSFRIGLTNATEYHRFQTVDIKAINYTSGQHTVKITYDGETVFESAPNASDGMIIANWTIPANASLGVYTVTIQRKPLPKLVPDIQNFTVVSKSFTCEVRTLNLDNEPIEGVQIEANNITGPVEGVKVTNDEGIASLYLEATNYTFVAYWSASPALPARVGETPWINLASNLTDTQAVNITCPLAHIKVAVKDYEGTSMPYVEVHVNFTYIGRLDYAISDSVLIETDPNGISEFRNMYTNIEYTIQAIRYDHAFETAVLNLTSTRWLNLTAPTYRLVINVFDRIGWPLQDAQVKVYEWSIGLGDQALEKNTGASGQVDFNSTFGKYVVSVYKNSYLVNKTTLLLKEQPTTLTIHCKLYSLTLDVAVVDYLGQGIPNANVTIEREGVVLSSLNTGGNGLARFTELVGGKYKVYVHIGGKPQEITIVDLQEPTTLTTRIAEVVSIAGLLTETSSFLTISLTLLVIAIFLSVLVYRRLRPSPDKE